MSARQLGVAASLMIVAGLVVPVLIGDEPPAKQEPPVRLKKKARPQPAEESRQPEAKPEERAKEKLPEPAKKPQPPIIKGPGDEPEAPADSAADPREILSRVSKNMREAEDRLGKRDPGTATQQKQRDVVADLDKLIDQQQQQQEQQASNSSSSSQQQQRMRRRQQQQQDQRTAQQQQQQQQQQQERQNSANRAGAGGRSQGSSKIADLYKDIWGHLPETMRQEMDAYSREQFMAKYNDLLKQYYSTLAEKGRRSGD